MRSLAIKTMCLAVLVCITMSCTAGGSAATPETVHVTWVQAMQTNDRVAARAVAGMHELDVDKQLQNMAYWRDVDEGGPLFPGRFRSVEIRHIATDGAGWRGYSLWTFEYGVECREAIIVQERDRSNRRYPLVCREPTRLRGVICTTIGSSPPLRRAGSWGWRSPPPYSSTYYGQPRPCESSRMCR
ncbi:hypothetical protein HC891_26565 [Candidatus Gracilibacteria bacterium]|nr:hypothetical protein [Candidatus Gracilibacteria bacterium]